MISTLDIFGAIGLSLLLLAFFLNLIHKLRRDSYTYCFINFFGGSILAAYGMIINAVIFMILNSFWALVALFGIIEKKVKSGYPETIK